MFARRKPSGVAKVGRRSGKRNRLKAMSAAVRCGASLCLLVAWSVSSSSISNLATSHCCAAPLAGRVGLEVVRGLSCAPLPPFCESCRAPAASTARRRGRQPLRLMLRGGSDGEPEAPVEGKDTAGWRHFREDSIQDYSIRDPDEDSHASGLDWGDGADDMAGADPTLLPFDTTRERLEAPKQNFSLWMRDYMAENTEYEIPPDPPFKGVKWVAELERVFNRLQNEWELEQLNETTACPDGPYHPRAGSFHKNPALDLSTAGVMDRSWDTARLSQYARLKAELQPQHGASWKERADEDEAEDDYSSVETPTSTVLLHNAVTARPKPEPETRTRNPKPETRNPKPESPTPEKSLHPNLPPSTRRNRGLGPNLNPKSLSRFSYTLNTNCSQFFCHPPAAKELDDARSKVRAGLRGVPQLWRGGLGPQPRFQ
jgi:hypothetical protein